jgi:hypothetical protein
VVDDAGIDALRVGARNVRRGRRQAHGRGHRDDSGGRRWGPRGGKSVSPADPISLSAQSTQSHPGA